MSSFTGLFELQTPGDLLKKLEYDYARLQKAPLDQYAAFDFFVTAEHMRDWVYPGKEHKRKRKQVLDNSVLLQVCSHIGNGAKHFRATDPRHVSVKDAKPRETAFQGDAFENTAFDVSSELVIELQGMAVQELGDVIGVLDLAQKVLDFWKQYRVTL